MDWRERIIQNIGCDLDISEYIKEFELLGYNHEEAIELAKYAVLPITINPELGWDEIVEAFNSVPEIYPIRTEDLQKVLERSNNE